MSDNNNNNNIVAVVTGANKGLGFVLVKLLAQRHPNNNWTIYLTARDEKRGKLAVDSLSSSSPKNVVNFHQLDIGNLQSVQNFKTFLQQKHGVINLLINNAGVMPQVRAGIDDDDDGDCRYYFDKEAVRSTVVTNFFGTLNVLRELFPLMSRENGTVINISSRLARTFYRKCTPLIQRRFDEAKNVDDLTSLADDFIKVAAGDNNDDLQTSGWLNTNPATALHMSYRIGDLIPIGFTHSAIAALTVIFQNEALLRNDGESNNNIAVNTACPGSIKTDMNPTGVYSPEHGAESILYLASRLDEKPWDDQVATFRGQFIAERQSYADWRQVPSDIAEDTS